MNADVMSFDQEAAKEFAARLEGEMQKAIAKYGEIALAPAGHPEYNIFDYLTNELVGEVRYGEMTIARAKMMYDTRTIQKADYDELVTIGEACIRHAIECGVRLILVQQKMRRNGLQLGTSERGILPEPTKDTIEKLHRSGFSAQYKGRNALYR